MERYSVMFGQVLNPKSKSSLLARRQATINPLKTVPDEDGPLELPNKSKIFGQTPHHTRQSPSFSLFPSTPKNSDYSPSPLLRANTSPAILPSPVREKFQQSDNQRREMLGKPIVASSGELRKKDSAEQVKSKVKSDRQESLAKRGQEKSACTASSV